MNLGAYEVEIAGAEIPEPVWPAETFEALLEIAFKGKMIEDLNHPAIRRLRGLQ